MLGAGDGQLDGGGDVLIAAGKTLEAALLADR